MRIEIAYATDNSQKLLEVEVPDNTTIKQAVELIGLGSELGITYPAVGIFGKLRSLDWIVKDGDRIELYRPLIATPNENRLRRAKQHKLRKNAKKLNKKQ